MSTSEMVPAKKARQKVEEVFDQNEGAMVAACPDFTEAARAYRIAKTAVVSNPALMECTGVSLLSGVMQSMQLGLVLDGILGHGYLVPYTNRKKGTKEAQLIAGYKGLMELAYRSGKILSIEADIVRADDVFEFERGTDSRLKHRPQINGAEITAVWALARVKDELNHPPFVVMSIDEIQAVRRAAKSQYGPWVDHFEEMAKKTAIRRLCKYLPASPDLQRAVTLQELADDGRPPVIEHAAAELLPEPEPEQDPNDWPEEKAQDDFDAEADRLFPEPT